MNLGSLEDRVRWVLIADGKFLTTALWHELQEQVQNVMLRGYPLQVAGSRCPIYHIVSRWNLLRITVKLLSWWSLWSCRWGPNWYLKTTRRKVKEHLTGFGWKPNLESKTILKTLLLWTTGKDREIQRKHLSGYRCNERIKAKTDGYKRLTYTGLSGDLEHLTIETRLISESFEFVMGECVI